MKTVNEYYKEKFGCKVYKLSLDGGFTCPNRDGTCGTGGCTFCLGGSDGFAAKGEDIKKQLADAKRLVKDKNKDGRYIAYFQSYTGTYAPTARLKELYESAIEPEDVVGLSVATRPDCISDETIALLSSLNERKYVSVELGLQTVNDETAAKMNRGYKTEVYFDAVKRLKAAGINVVTHIIIGLPGENGEDAVLTTRAAVAAGTDGVKFHLLHVLRGTPLENEYKKGLFSCLTLEEYGAILKNCIAELPKNVVVHRITGDGKKSDLIAPLWSADKKRTLNYLNRILNS